MTANIRSEAGKKGRGTGTRPIPLVSPCRRSRLELVAERKLDVAPLEDRRVGNTEGGQHGAARTGELVRPRNGIEVRMIEQVEEVGLEAQLVSFLGHLEDLGNGRV